MITNKNKNLFATATGTTSVYIIDQIGKRVPVRISSIFVTGLGRKVVSSIEAIKSGVTPILETGKPHLQLDRITSLPLTQYPEDDKAYALRIFFFATWATQGTRYQRPL